jgi:hypothetical protein
MCFSVSAPFNLITELIKRIQNLDYTSCRGPCSQSFLTWAPCIQQFCATLERLEASARSLESAATGISHKRGYPPIYKALCISLPSNEFWYLANNFYPAIWRSIHRRGLVISLIPLVHLAPSLTTYLQLCIPPMIFPNLIHRLRRG